MCHQGDFISEKFKLYEEIPSTGKSQRQAKPNLGFQVGLQECPRESTKARILVASTNTPPPSMNALQKAPNKAAQLSAVLADKDLEKRRANIKANIGPWPTTLS